MSNQICPCPHCANGLTNQIHQNSEMIAMVVNLKRKMDEQDLWKHMPKLAEIFQYRPAVNNYWHEMIWFYNQMRMLDEDKSNE